MLDARRNPAISAGETKAVWSYKLVSLCWTSASNNKYELLLVKYSINIQNQLIIYFLRNNKDMVVMYLQLEYKRNGTNMCS